MGLFSERPVSNNASKTDKDHMVDIMAEEFGSSLPEMSMMDLKQDKDECLQKMYAPDTSPRERALASKGHRMIVKEMEKRVEDHKVANGVDEKTLMEKHLKNARAKRAEADKAYKERQLERKREDFNNMDFNSQEFYLRNNPDPNKLSVEDL